MTVKELSQLFYLNREIEMDTKRLEELRANVGSLASPSLSGMPHGGDNQSKVEREAVELAALEAMIVAKKKRCIAEQLRLENYIQSIEESITRQVFTYRFINGLPWEQVAACIGGGNTQDSVKKCCYRYIKYRNQAEKEAAK